MRFFTHFKRPPDSLEILFRKVPNLRAKGSPEHRLLIIPYLPRFPNEYSVKECPGYTLARSQKSLSVYPEIEFLSLRTTGAPPPPFSPASTPGSHPPAARDTENPCVDAR